MSSESSAPPKVVERTFSNGSPPALPPRPSKPAPTHDPPPAPFDIDQDVENDDEISQQMTASYSEISFKSGGLSPEIEVPMAFPIESAAAAYQEHSNRPVSLQCDKMYKPLGPLTLEGTVHVEGNMTHFIAEDLEYKIKLSSPQAKKGDTPPLPGNSRSGTPSTLYRQNQSNHISQLDARLLNDLEAEAQRMATSIDNLTENLCEILHSISSITAGNVEVYKNAVSKMSDAMDANIKSMYTMMAKAEEVTQTMKSVQAQATRLKEIKRLVDLFETYV